MPISVHYTDDGGVLITSEGVLTGEEIVASKDRLYASPERIRSIVYQLADFRKVKDISLSTQAVVGIAERDQYAAGINPDMLIAVVSKDDLHYGMSRMWEEYCAQGNVRAKICRSMEEARQWIREQLGPREAGAPQS